MAPELPAAVPQIPVTDVEAATAYYRDRLGFGVDWLATDIGLAGVSRDRCRLFLAGPGFRDGAARGAPAVTWLNLDSVQEVEALHGAWRSAGARVLSAPERTPWGLHEFTAADPDGNQFRVFYDVGTPERERARSTTP